MRATVGWQSGTGGGRGKAVVGVGVVQRCGNEGERGRGRVIVRQDEERGGGATSHASPPAPVERIDSESSMQSIT